jgi:hypothetical protein
LSFCFYFSFSLPILLDSTSIIAVVYDLTFVAPWK